jgi:outer membrane protein assembly factor BamB
MVRALAGFLLLLPAPAMAQTHALAKRIVLPAESVPMRNRWHALDFQLALLGSTSAAVKLASWPAPAFPQVSLASVAVDGSSQEKWEQVLDDYFKLMDEAGDALVPPRPVRLEDPMPPPSLQVRRLGQLRIAAMPPPLLKLYRRRVDAPAQKLLDDGKKERSPALLRRLVQEYFCSRPAEDAVDVLGDLAFEQGRFEEALAWWRLLALPPGEAPARPSDGLLFPDPTLDLARIRAKEVLAYAFLDRNDRARQELDAFRKLHPDAKGALAGTTGPYAATLESWIRRLVAHGLRSNDAPWTTFAGNPERNRAMAVCPPSRLWSDGPTWRVRLPIKNEPGPEPRLGPPSRLAFHPLVVGDQVLVGSARSVIGHDLFTGRQLFRFDLKEGGPEDAKSGEGRFTLTAGDRCVFARLGGQSLGPKSAEDKEEAASVLVCLELAGPKPGGLRWRIGAVTPGADAAYFEGAPLAEGGLVFCAVSRVIGQRAHTAVACYDAETGARRWWRDVCETPEFEEQAEPRTRQHLLTMGGGMLFYCAHAGAVVALDPWSGQCLWGTRYPTRGPKTEEGFPTPRDLAPGVYADGRLYVAPLDADRLLCLDAANGRLLWEREATEVVHLLGEARGRVYFTTPRGLQCLRAADGSTHEGWVQPAEGRLPGLGRGLVAGSWLLWPTQDPKLPLRGVTLADGNQERFDVPKSAPEEPQYLEPTMLRAILPGNMAFGQGCLAVAGLEELAVYVPQRRFLKERDENLKDARDTPLNLYQLAMSQADAGFPRDAEKNLRRLQTLSQGAGDAWHGLSTQRLAELEGSLKSPRSLPLFPPALLRAGSVSDGGPEPHPVSGQSLDLPFEKAFAVPARHIRLVPGPSGLVLCQQNNGLACLDTTTGRTKWHSALSGDEPTLWLDGFADVAIRADSQGLAGFNLQDGKLSWTHDAPLRPTLPYALAQEQPTRLTNPFPPAHFHAGRRFLFFVVDQRLLVALDPEKGRCVWIFWAPGGRIRPLEGGGRFHPHYHAEGGFLVLQTTAGKRLTLDSLTGKLLDEGPAHAPWPRPPLALDERRLVLADEAGQVLLLDAATGKVVWTYQPPGPTGLTGAPANVFGDKEKLLALVPRNIGPELIRLDANRGTLLWSVPTLAHDFDVGTASLDQGAVYFAAGNSLQARSLSAGKLLWKKTLPGTFPGWQTVRAGDVLLVYPRENIPWTWPFTWPVALGTMDKARGERGVLMLDPRDGQWLERLPLTDPSGPMTVETGENRLLVAAGGTLRVYRPLGR